jgi:hypothetical protein
MAIFALLGIVPALLIRFAHAFHPVCLMLDLV